MKRKAEDRVNWKRFMAPIVALGSVAAIVMFLMATPITAMAQTFEFKMAHSEGIGTPITDAFETWGKMLKERSGGKIDAKHFPASQLGSYTQLIEGSRRGLSRPTAGGTDTEEAVAPEIAVTGLGFIFKDEAHVDRVLQGPIGKEMSDIARQKTGVEFVDYAEVGFRHLLTKKPVNNLAELKGQKLRVPELKVWVNFWKALARSDAPGLRRTVQRPVHRGHRRPRGRFFLHQQLQMVRAGQIYGADVPLVPCQGRPREYKMAGQPPQGSAETGARHGERGVCRARKINRANTVKVLDQLKAQGVKVVQPADIATWQSVTAFLYADYAKQFPKAGPMIEKIKALK